VLEKTTKMEQWIVCVFLNRILIYPILLGAFRNKRLPYVLCLVFVCLFYLFSMIRRHVVVYYIYFREWFRFSTKDSRVFTTALSFCLLMISRRGVFFRKKMRLIINSWSGFGRFTFGRERERERDREWERERERERDFQYICIKYICIKHSYFDFVILFCVCVVERRSSSSLSTFGFSSREGFSKDE